MFRYESDIVIIDQYYLAGASFQKICALRINSTPSPIFLHQLPNGAAQMQPCLPYRVACLLTLPVTDLHLSLSCAILLQCSKLKPAHCRMLSLCYSRDLLLPRFTSTMPSSRLRCKLSCLIMCLNKESFYCFTV